MVKFSLFPIVALLSTTVIHAQPETADSLINIWKDEQQIPSLRYQALYQFFQDHYYIKPKRLDTLAVQLETSAGIDINTRHSGALLLKATAAHSRDSVLRSIELLARALDDYADRSIITFHINQQIIRSQNDLGNIDGAIPYALDNLILAYFLKEEYPLQEVIALNTIGYLYDKMGYTEKALGYLNDALKVVSEHEAIPPVAAIGPKTNICRIYTRTHRFPEAEMNCKESIDLANQYGRSFPLTNLYGMLIDIYLQEGKIEDAKALIPRLKASSIRVESVYNELISLKWEGQVALREGRSREAISICREGFDLAHTHHYFELFRDMCDCLVQSYREEDQLDQVVYYLSQRIAIADSLENVLMASKLASFEGRMKQQEEQIAREKNYRQEAFRARRNQNIAMAALLVIAFLLLIFFSEFRARKRMSLVNDKLRKLHQKADLLLKSLSHDILSNLDYILSTGSVMVEQDASPKNLGHFYETTTESVRRIKHYCLGLLHSFRDKPEASLVEDTDANEILNEILAQLDSVIRFYGIEVERTTLPLLPVERAELSIIFYNLLDNAIQVIKNRKPGRIAVITQSEVHYDRPEKIWRIGIMDNGPGVRDSEKIAVFEMWNSTKAGGGLGLWLVSNIMERRNGEVWIEDNDWGGATFWFSFKV
ncbi:tetratricopeptide repeat-containing sensor histidine kinase [Flavilitoribacter nigricans]|uniref:histidine kinase n=1 Tax=Flavilitoribacter nigricans (strain ATCC 23147 / DSM 23189 / NBRC 102662 / NCIMB 1420 / SS-2) TaxID=1122177 RepID=A0A2D0NEW8_FLAN2|nr:HAMP domain-containing sensor histidine kinase [Flavilitoribacter nigricans]PHN07042.1 hypothetical protein CRP01_08775 [Flavilitoribacter nigricans DSM 23189 = NBRC 102662]